MNPQPFPKIIADTDRYLAVEKTPGISFHTQGKEQGILQLIRTMEDEGAIRRGPRLFPVHRLDRVTSGILLFARQRINANLISNEFRHNRVEKYYVALSSRRPQRKKGCVSGDMQRGRGSSWILSRERKNPSVTYFFSTPVSNRRSGLRLFLLKPKTGKTHQIRVAMKSLGAPILGDSLYGRFDLAREEERTYLHACFLRFLIGEERVTLVSTPGPGTEFENDAFRSAYRQFDQPDKLPWPR